MLELAAEEGRNRQSRIWMNLSFCAWSEPSYSYYQRGEQKRLEQTKRRGRRLSIPCVFSTSNQFCLRFGYWGC